MRIRRIFIARRQVDNKLLWRLCRWDDILLNKPGLAETGQRGGGECGRDGAWGRSDCGSGG